MSTKRRENFVKVAGLPRRNFIPLKCRDCGHEFLFDSLFRLSNGSDIKSFQSNKVKCPECEKYSCPSILILEPDGSGDSNDMPPVIKHISFDNKGKSDKGKLIILDDWKGFLDGKNKKK